MNSVPTWIVFVHSFIAGGVISWLGLLLVNIRPTIKQVAVVGLCYAAYATILRCLLMLPLDISFVLQIPLLLILVMLISRLGVIKSAVATILGTIVLFAGEVVFALGLMQGLGINPASFRSTLIFLFIPIPQIVMTSIVIYLCLKFDFHLFDFAETGQIPSAARKGRRLQTVVALVSMLLLVTVGQLIFSISILNREFVLFKSLSLSTIGILSTVILILGFAVIIILILQLVELIQKESEHQMQTLYIDTLDDLYTAVRSERHDLINHFQTIYGFNQLGYNKEVEEYLIELLEGSILSNRLIDTGSPGLTAMIYIKSGIASAEGIDFNVIVDKKIDNLIVPPYELNTILGNLINNAFDAVMSLDAGKKEVSIFIGSQGDSFVFTVSNYGYLSADIKDNIMCKGFTTKKEGAHSGLGLYTCSQLCRKYGGGLQVRNTEDHMVEFSVFIPIY